MTDNLDVSNTNGLPFMYEQRHPALIIFIAIKNYTAYLRVHQVHNFLSKKEKKNTHTQKGKHTKQNDSLQNILIYF